MTGHNAATDLDLYTWSTPNGRKVPILLEELGLPYRVIPIDITKGDQRTDSFLALNPNGKIPVLVDHEADITLMESGVILMYLANKYGKFMGQMNSTTFWIEMQWLMFQVGHVGPMLGQTHHFLKYNPGKAPYAEERYRKENRRIYKVLEKRLSGRDYICDEYSIVDMAIWPWISRYEYQQMDLNDYPGLKQWYLRIATRPAVQRGYRVPEDLPVPIPQ